MVSRRWFLTMAAALGGAATAGCQRIEKTSARAVCDVSHPENRDHDVFTLPPNVRPVGDSEPILVDLQVPIRQSVLEATNVELVEVLTGTETRHRLLVDEGDDPIGETERYEYDDVIEYAQSIGFIPQTNRYRLHAIGGGVRLDSITMEFRCYREVSEER